MTMDRVLSWAIKQVQQTEQASDIILKDEFFSISKVLLRTVNEEPPSFVLNLES